MFANVERFGQNVRNYLLSNPTSVIICLDYRCDENSTFFPEQANNFALLIRRTAALPQNVARVCPKLAAYSTLTAALLPHLRSPVERLSPPGQVRISPSHPTAV